MRHFDGRGKEGWGKGIWLTIVLGALLLGMALGMEVERQLVKARQANPPAQSREE